MTASSTGVPSASALATAEAVAEHVGFLGGRWMLHPETLGPCKEVGYPNGFAYYVAGRGGVLGDVDADVVIAGFMFFEPGLTRKMWEAGVAVEGARGAAARYRGACQAFGAARFGEFAGAARLAELAERIVRAVDPSGLPLFAGWRAEPLPDDPAARAYQLIHVLRELRGSQHIVACVAHGFAPRDAVLTAGGEAAAKQFGWPEPFPDPAPLMALRTDVETMTNNLSAAAMSVLDETEQAEFVGLVTAARAHFDALPA